MSITRLQPGPRLSQAIVHGGLVYLAGQVAVDPAADTETQTRQILGKIDAVLAQAGTGKARLLTATVWLTDINDYAAMNRAWDAWIEPGCAPARACIESRLAAPGLKVEIGGIAAL